MVRRQGLAAADPAAARRTLMAHIEQHFDQTDLCPRKAAAALGWPLRRVHAVMGGEPLSFMRCVTRLRLDAARRLLAERRLTVTEAAFACGFDSLATFYRQYGAAFGTTPATERQRAAPVPRPDACVSSASMPAAPPAMSTRLMTFRQSERQRARIEKTVPQATGTMALLPPA